MPFPMPTPKQKNTAMLKFVLTIVISLGIFFTLPAQEDLGKIDSNFKTEKVEDVDVEMHNALEPPFELHGFPWRQPGEILRRLPVSLTQNEINSGVFAMSKRTSGGCIRFSTNSPVVFLRAKLANGTDGDTQSRSGADGIDAYINYGNGIEHHWRLFAPSRDEAFNGAPMVRRLYNRPAGNPAGVTNWILYLPLYGGVDALEIGIQPGCEILPPKPRKITKDIVFYGSSITQGGCASRAGLNYTTLLCRELDAYQVNLGFSGSARGEEAMARYIASLDNMGVFVMDYDYNAKNPEHLQKTHEPFFKIIREAHPKLPIIILTRVTLYEDKRTAVIKETYDNAIANGDKHVYFVEGKTLFDEDARESSSVDRCHPNDLGFYQMYKKLLPVVRQALAEAED